MQRPTTGAILWKVAAAAGVLLLAPLARAADDPAQPAAPQDAPSGTPGAARPSFDDLQAISQSFADELGRFKERNQTTPPAKLAQQAEAAGTYPVATTPDPGKRLNAEAIYARTRPGVVVVGGLFKCDTCRRWHVRCASGFVVRRDGLILTNQHVVEGYKGLEAVGVRTDDGRVFPVKAVLASNRLDDLALLKVDADGLQPLPVSSDISVGATVYCLSHPAISTDKANCFYAFSQGIVAGKFTTRNDKQRPLQVLAITAEYGLGSSGGPILNEHGAVVGMACQATPQMQREQEKGVLLVWRFCRPSRSILAMLSPSTAKTVEKSVQDREDETE